MANLWLILSEKLNRTITSIAGAVLMLGIGMFLGIYTEAIDSLPADRRERLACRLIAAPLPVPQRPGRIAKWHGKYWLYWPDGTIIGSTANIVVVSLSERTRTPITSSLWNRRGLPVMLATCVVASILYIFAFPLFNR